MVGASGVEAYQMDTPKRGMTKNSKARNRRLSFDKEGGPLSLPSVEVTPFDCVCTMKCTVHFQNIINLGDNPTDRRNMIHLSMLPFSRGFNGNPTLFCPRCFPSPMKLRSIQLHCSILSVPQFFAQNQVFVSSKGIT